MEEVQSCGSYEAFSSEECEKLHYQMNCKCYIRLMWQGINFGWRGSMQGGGIQMWLFETSSSFSHI